MMLRMGDWWVEYIRHTGPNPLVPTGKKYIWSICCGEEMLQYRELDWENHTKRKLPVFLKAFRHCAICKKTC